MAHYEIDTSKLSSLVKAGWAIAVALATVAGAIFYAGEQWTVLTKRVGNVEAAAARVESYKSLEGARLVLAAPGFHASCPVGHVVTSVAFFEGGKLQVNCAKL